MRLLRDNPLRQSYTRSQEDKAAQPIPVGLHVEISGNVQPVLRPLFDRMRTWDRFYSPYIPYLVSRVKPHTGAWSEGGDLPHNRGPQSRRGLNAVYFAAER